MIVADLDPGRAVYVLPGGGVAHTRRCPTLDGREKRKRAGQLWGDTPVCRRCRSKPGPEPGTNGLSKSEAATLLEDLTPEDWP